MSASTDYTRHLLKTVHVWLENEGKVEPDYHIKFVEDGDRWHMDVVPTPPGAVAKPEFNPPLTIWDCLKNER